MQGQVATMLTYVPTDRDLFENYLTGRRELVGDGSWEAFAKRAGVGPATIYRVMNHGPNEGGSHLSSRNAIARALELKDWADLVRSYGQWRDLRDRAARMGDQLTLEEAAEILEHLKDTVPIHVLLRLLRLMSPENRDIAAKLMNDMVREGIAADAADKTSAVGESISGQVGVGPNSQPPVKPRTGGTALIKSGMPQPIEPAPAPTPKKAKKPKGAKP